MGGCQISGPFLGTLNNRMPYYIKDPKRDPNCDNHPHVQGVAFVLAVRGLGPRNPKFPLTPNPKPKTPHPKPLNPKP